MLNQTVIFCGGFGKRLLPLTKKIPKAMVFVNGKPFLYHLIIQSKKNGIKNFLILCGYKHEIIKKYFGDGSKFGVSINYHYNEPRIETLKRLLDARHLLKKSFLLLYGDNYSSLNLHDLTNQKYFKKKSLLITVCKKKNGNILLDKKNKLIKKYFFKKKSFSNYVEIGYMILEKNILPVNNNQNISFNLFIDDCVKKSKAFFYLNDSGYLSISDINRLQITRKFFKQKIILLDRDGVINYKNKKHYYVRSLNELRINFKFIKKYYKLLKYKKIICITNQAGIATGDLKKTNLILIHKKIVSEYKKKRLKIVDFFVSNHHFLSTHFDRKPGHGLFLKASQKYNFILDRVIYIGDDLRDAQAAYNAKTKFIYLGKKTKNNFPIHFKNTLIENYNNNE